MKTNTGHLTYCTNIHAGKNWIEDFRNLQNNFPEIKKAIAAEQDLGIGLRLSNAASLELLNEDTFDTFTHWLEENNAYVFTMNGFPYGEFHHTTVKEEVHSPDWTTNERRSYTIRLFSLLAKLLPAGLEGGISTSPLSYRHWYETTEDADRAKYRSTLNIIAVVKELINIEQQTGKVLHLDLEPEPDGLIETGREYIDWFENDLLVLGIPAIISTFNVSAEEATGLIKKHLCLCYDVCHFAIGYENHAAIIEELNEKGIKVGKIQISAALKANLEESDTQRKLIQLNFEEFNEPTYLHQVVALKTDGNLLRYPDLPQALADLHNPAVKQWRAHFHVPISIEETGNLQSTQEDILQVLALQKHKPFTQHLEVETYTWEVLPEQLKIPITESIIKEMNWVIDKAI